MFKAPFPMKTAKTRGNLVHHSQSHEGINNRNNILMKAEGREESSVN